MKSPRVRSYSVLSYEQVKRLVTVMREPFEVHGIGNFPTLHIRIQDLIREVSNRITAKGLTILNVKMNGGLACHILASSTELPFNDIDLIFGIELGKSSANFDIVKRAVLDSLLEFLPAGANKTRLSSASLKDAYVRKMVKVTDGDTWSLIALNNDYGHFIELKFVDRMRRQFEFSVDSFQIQLDSLMTFFDSVPQLSPALLNEAVRTSWPNDETDSLLSSLEHASPSGSLSSYSEHTTGTPDISEPGNPMDSAVVEPRVSCSMGSSVHTNSSDKFCSQDEKALSVSPVPRLTSPAISETSSGADSGRGDSETGEQDEGLVSDPNLPTQSMQRKAAEGLSDFKMNSSENPKRPKSLLLMATSITSTGSTTTVSLLSPTLDLDSIPNLSASGDDARNEEGKDQNDAIHMPNRKGLTDSYELSSGFGSREQYNWDSKVRVTADFFPSVTAESLYGDFDTALRHLEERLIDTKRPEEIRGGGLLKYCNLLVRNYRPARPRHIRQLEKYMCSRFFIDFPDVSTQILKLSAYLNNHFPGDPALKYEYLMILYRVVSTSTICLMSHERHSTLEMIEHLSYQISAEMSSAATAVGAAAFASIQSSSMYSVDPVDPYNIDPQMYTMYQYSVDSSVAYPNPNAHTLPSDASQPADVAKASSYHYSGRDTDPSPQDNSSLWSGQLVADGNPSGNPEHIPRRTILYLSNAGSCWMPLQ